MKIALEINDKGFSNIDISNPINGNPGVGGTWYEFALLAYMLKKYCPNYEIYIYHYNDNKYITDCAEKIIKNDTDLFEQIVHDKIDLFIFKTNKQIDWYTNISKYEVNSIAWTHTFLGFNERKLIENNEFIKRMVCVGKEHYDLYLDEDVINKTTYIYNMVCKTDEDVRRKEYDNNVTYIGSIIPAKSLHVLAKVWKGVLKEVPTAKLNIIGSGKLYERDSVLGEYGIAEKNYEKRFIKYLTDENGEILDSVNFLGVLGEEKKEVICNSAVGVVNPTTKSETFCISAVEFEEYGVPVCSGRKNGLLDTVVHKSTGLLSFSSIGLKRNIVKLLQNKMMNEEYSKNARYHSEKFLPESIINDWIKCIENINNNENEVYINPKGNMLYNGKFARVIFRFLRFNLGMRSIPSTGSIIHKSKYIYHCIRRR